MNKNLGPALRSVHASQAYYVALSDTIKTAELQVPQSSE